MRLRQYHKKQDYETLEKWIENERTHALWSADLISYPIRREDFHAFLDKNARVWSAGAYIAENEDGEAVGFLCYDVDSETLMGFLTLVIVAPDQRGRGYGKEMMKLALSQAFEEEKAEKMRLNVFSANEAARCCYEALGFLEESKAEGAFSYHDEKWDRCLMLLERQRFQKLKL